MTARLDHKLQFAMNRFLEAQPYYPCCLLIELDLARLSNIAILLGRDYKWPTLSVGSVVSEKLLGIGTEARPLAVQDLLSVEVRKFEPGPLLCTDIDLLFEPVL